MQGNERFQVVIVGGGQGVSRSGITSPGEGSPLSFSTQTREWATPGGNAGTRCASSVPPSTMVFRVFDSLRAPVSKPTKDQMGNYLEGYASHFSCRCAPASESLGSRGRATISWWRRERSGSKRSRW